MIIRIFRNYKLLVQWLCKSQPVHQPKEIVMKNETHKPEMPKAPVELGDANQLTQGFNFDFVFDRRTNDKFQNRIRPR
jgi:hypothetical protein